MSLVQFEHIWTFLHPDDSEKQILQGQPGHDKLYKVQDFLDLLSERTQSVYWPNQEVSIDEVMIPSKRVIVICSVYEVQAYTSIQLFTLADTHSGYAYRFKVMVMQCETLIPLAIVGVLTGHVVLEHFHGLKSNGFEVCTNN